MKVYRVTIPKTYVLEDLIPVYNRKTLKYDGEFVKKTHNTTTWEYRIPLVGLMDGRQDILPYVYECFATSNMTGSTDPQIIREDVRRWYERFLTLDPQQAQRDEKDMLEEIYWEDTPFYGHVKPGYSKNFREDMLTAMGWSDRYKENITASFPWYAIVTEVKDQDEVNPEKVLELMPYNELKKLANSKGINPNQKASVLIDLITDLDKIVNENEK